MELLESFRACMGIEIPANASRTEIEFLKILLPLIPKVFRVDGNALFPIYNDSGAPTGRYMFYVNDDVSFQKFANTLGPEQKDAMILACGGQTSHQVVENLKEIDQILAEAEEGK